MLNSSGGEVPGWVTQRVIEFCEPWFPFVRAPKIISSTHTQSVKPRREEKEKEKDGMGDWNVNPDGIDGEGMLEDKVDFVQDFYIQLEEGLRVELGMRSSGKDENEMDAVEGDNGNGKDAEEREKTDESEMRIRDIMELVERAICSFFYDRYVVKQITQQHTTQPWCFGRLFMQPQTDDSQHDTALSNRVAALNLLDLTLEHLDIEVGQASATKVNAVVRACGQSQFLLQYYIS